MEKVKVEFVPLYEDAKEPVKATDGAACFDIHAYLPDMTTPLPVYPGSFVTIGTGIAVQLPKGYEMQVRPRSGWASKHGVTVLNSPGTIDSDYRGEVGVIIINHGRDTIYINHGDRIAQVVIKPVPEVEFVKVEKLDKTKRGDGGFGSTGK